MNQIFSAVVNVRDPNAPACFDGMWRPIRIGVEDEYTFKVMRGTVGGNFPTNQPDSGYMVNPATDKGVVFVKVPSDENYKPKLNAIELDHAETVPERDWSDNAQNFIGYEPVVWWSIDRNKNIISCLRAHQSALFYLNALGIHVFWS